ncbi:hypothetical protein L9F63_005770, partial [Diploptera punctata]
QININIEEIFSYFYFSLMIYLILTTLWALILMASGHLTSILMLYINIEMSDLEDFDHVFDIRREEEYDRIQLEEQENRCNIARCRHRCIRYYLRDTSRASMSTYKNPFLLLENTLNIPMFLLMNWQQIQHENK